MRALFAAAAALFALSPAHATATTSFEPLVGTAAERVLVSDRVAAAKWGTDLPIEDPQREEQVLADAAERAVELGIDPAVAREVFRDQIEASKLVQRALHAHWAAHPQQQPDERPDLADIRPEIDRLNEHLLLQLRDTAQLRGTPSCPGRLTVAYQHIRFELQLDPLHRTGLARALSSVCWRG